jgi:hypothetical protein
MDSFGFGTLPRKVDLPERDSTEEESVKRQPKKAGPAVPGDAEPLAGLWRLSRKGSLPKVMCIAEGSLMVFDFATDFDHTATSGVTFDLEERGGRWFLVHSDYRTVVAEYRLDGDRLELDDRPAGQPDLFVPDSPGHWKLTGRWLRLKDGPDAEPAAAPDRRGT